MRRYPYHRYLTYQVLNGDDVDDVIGHMRDLEYAPPLSEDIEEMCGHLRRRRVTHAVRERHGVLFFDDEAMDIVNWIVETPVARTCAERMLLDRVHPKHVATILGLKFGLRVSALAIDRFRDGFWDTATLTNVDFAEYFRLGGRRKPEPPPTSLASRPAYSAWREGLIPDEEDLSPDAMIREIQVDAFMRYKETSDRNDHKTAMDYAKLVLKTAPARKSLYEAKRTTGDVMAIKPLLKYPEETVATIGELHSEYSQAQSGTGAVSEATGRREGDEDSRA